MRSIVWKKCELLTEHFHKTENTQHLGYYIGTSIVFSSYYQSSVYLIYPKGHALSNAVYYAVHSHHNALWMFN